MGGNGAGSALARLAVRVEICATGVGSSCSRRTHLVPGRELRGSVFTFPADKAWRRHEAFAARALNLGGVGNGDVAGCANTTLQIYSRCIQIW